jgi:hydrogenase maturation protein HypF
MKNTVALAWDKRIVISPHIGDLSSHRGLQIFEQVIDDLQSIYQVKAEVILCDRHPQYASTRWAKAQPQDTVAIQHHQAHASSLINDDQATTNKMLVFTWDGTGFGDDGSIWGGETFFGGPANWRRVASLKPIRLPGGEQAALQPWRSAAAMQWLHEHGNDLRPDHYYDEYDSTGLVRTAWENDINCFTTSSIGRLFDAVASMLGVTQQSSYDGEAPMLLEAMAESVNTCDSLPLLRSAFMAEIDWSPLLKTMRDSTQTKAYRAGYFHALLANTVTQMSLRFAEEFNFDSVGLCGGVFQNKMLTERITHQLQQRNINVIMPTRIPVNDGGLSYGQVIEYAARLNDHA